MITFDFNYYQPTTLSDAVEIYRQCQLGGLVPFYYAGGTEILSFARRNRLHTHALIDIKGIPECQVLQYENNRIAYGAALPLNQIIQSGSFPLLSESCRHVADHTNRNKITLGGNICGKIIYREALLPFLLSDSQVVTAGRSGVRQLPIRDLFNQGGQLDQGELLVQLIVPHNDTKKPYVFIKRTKQERIDYPLVSVAALKSNNKLHVAFSGVCAFPFRSQQIEDVLNDQALSVSERVSEALTLLPGVILDDIHGSSDYREFVLQDLLMETMATLEEV